MRRPSPSTLTGRHAEQPGIGGTRLHGHWLLLARLLWLAMFVLTLVVFCTNLLVGNYGLARTMLLVAVTSVWFAVSLVLFWCKSGDRAILLFSLILVLTGGVLFPPVPLALLHDRVWWLPVDFLWFLAAGTLTFVYTFPDGRFVPGFTRWLALGWIAVSLVPVPVPGAVYPWNWWYFPPYTLMRIAFYGSLALALLYRYRRRATPVQRLQIKWVVFAATVVVGEVSVASLLVFVLPSYFPALGLLTQLRQLVVGSITPILPVLFPLSIGIALLRYRLWDIDIIINRTLVYGTLTVILAGVYVGLVIGLQALLRGIISQDSSVAIVISTLAIAALFQPLRHRLQRVIDRRFYRSKYDAAKIVAAFSATLRQEVDLDQLREHLVAVVEETMQPAHVSLWVRPTQHDGKRSAWGAHPLSSRHTEAPVLNE